MATNNFDNKGNLQFLIGEHLNRMSDSNARGERDYSLYVGQLTELETLAFPILVEDKAFLAAWRSLHSQEKHADCPPHIWAAMRKPDGMPDGAWQQQLRDNEKRLMTWSLYQNHVLQRAPVADWDVST